MELCNYVYATLNSVITGPTDALVPNCPASRALTVSTTVKSLILDAPNLKT